MDTEGPRLRTGEGQEDRLFQTTRGILKGTSTSMEEEEETAMSVDAEFTRMKGLHHEDAEEDAKPKSQPAIQVSSCRGSGSVGGGSLTFLLLIL